MAIEQLGESLLSQQRERVARREREDEKYFKRQQRDQLLGLGAGIIGSLAQSAAQKKAASFMRQEPIMAARAKYNAGVAKSIAHLKRNDEAQAHQSGVQGYLRDSYIPLLSEQIMRTVNEKEYTKDGFDTYVYNEAVKLAKKNETLFNEATQAALRVGNDSAAFDKFIKVNDGIADNPLSAVGQSIAGMFKGKSKEALRQDSIMSNITASEFITDVTALEAAKSALAAGRPVLEAKKIAENIERYRATDEDYEEISRKDHVQTNQFLGKATTTQGQLVTYQDGWGRTREEFVPAVGQENPSKKTQPIVTQSQYTIGGVVYNRNTTVHQDVYGNPVSTPTVEDTMIGPDPKGAAGVSTAEAVASGESFRQRMATFESGLGAEWQTIGREGGGQAYSEYVLRDTEVEDEKVTKDLFDASYANMIAAAGQIAGSTNHDRYSNNSKDLPLAISQHIVLNDMSRIVQETYYGLTESEMDYSLSLRQTVPTSLEILEAIGSIKKSDAGNVDSEYIKNIVNSQEFYTNLNTLKNDKTGRQLSTWKQNFASYQDDPAYSHLFEPLVADSKGNTYSVYEIISRL